VSQRSHLASQRLPSYRHGYGAQRGGHGGSVGFVLLGKGAPAGRTTQREYVPLPSAVQQVTGLSISRTSDRCRRCRILLTLSLPVQAVRQNIGRPVVLGSVFVSLCSRPTGLQALIVRQRLATDGVCLLLSRPDFPTSSASSSALFDEAEHIGWFVFVRRLDCQGVSTGWWASVPSSPQADCCRFVSI